MTTTAIGLFEGFAEAQRVTQTLVAQGVQREEITIVANRAETAISDVIAAVAWGVPSMWARRVGVSRPR